MTVYEVKKFWVGFLSCIKTRLYMNPKPRLKIQLKKVNHIG